MTSVAPSTKQRQERLSAISVIVVAIVALLIGSLIRNAAQNQTRPFSNSGISAQIPVGWLTQDGTGDLILVARNAQALDQQYRINRLDGGELLLIAAQENEVRAGIEETFRVTEETPIIVRGREGYRVSYAFVDDDPTDIPTVIEGVSYYFAEADKTLVISYEADTNDFADGVPQFQQFRASVASTGGN